MIRVADFIARYLSERYGLSHVFLVTGGGAMHLNDAFGRCKDLSLVCFHHEQACAMAAEGYTKLTGKIPIVNLTTGPGGLNALNGVAGAFCDSIPMIVISGQVRYDTTVASTGLPLRQLGDQEFDIVNTVKTMTKYAVMITDPLMVKYHIDKAMVLAMGGRPGPVWIDVPLNVQAAMVDEDSFVELKEHEKPNETPLLLNEEKIIDVLDKISKAQRPVLLAGSGVRIAGVYKEFIELVELLQIPVLTAFNGHDCMYESHPLYIGRPGTVGNRAGNFVFQNADLLLVLGCRLNIRQIGYSWDTVARSAYKIFIDIDANELKKPTIQPDLAIHADLKAFLPKFKDIAEKFSMKSHKEWVQWGKKRMELYPVTLPEYATSKLVNPYHFIDKISEYLLDDDVVITTNGSACVCTFQAIKMKRGQRLFSNSGMASMGYDLPAAIGACIANDKKRIICMAGDGSIQMNIQELQTIVHYKLPVKVFVFNNTGYHSIRQTQSNFFGMPLFGCDSDSGVSFPDMEKIAWAYGIAFARCSSNVDVPEKVSWVLSQNGPVICELMITTDQPFAPKPSSKRLPSGKMVSKPLEDQAPFLSREEFLSNMVIQPVSEE